LAARRWRVGFLHQQPRRDDNASSEIPEDNPLTQQNASADV
jgi:hypothetical protein